jgi:nucleoid-associated protein YgaU
MRILLGIGILVAIFGLSTAWHRSEIRELRNPGGVHEREARAAEPRTLPPGWGEVILGAPSGAEPVFLEPMRPPADAPATGSPDAAVFEAPLSVEDWELPIRQGDVLSRIVRVHYGRVSPDLEKRLARYNGLESPDKLVVGEILYLPPEERLLALD